MVSVPLPGSKKGETGLRKVTELGVFGITAFSSVWAYGWMWICLSFWTPNRVTLTEAIITFIQFPILVAVSYGQDTNWGCCSKRGGEQKHNERYDLMSVIKSSKDTEEADVIKNLKSTLPPPKRSYMVYRVNAMRAASGKKKVIHDEATEGDEMDKDVAGDTMGEVELQ